MSHKSEGVQGVSQKSKRFTRYVPMSGRGLSQKYRSIQVSQKFAEVQENSKVFSGVHGVS